MKGRKSEWATAATPDCREGGALIPPWFPNWEPLQGSIPPGVAPKISGWVPHLGRFNQATPRVLAFPVCILGSGGQGHVCAGSINDVNSLLVVLCCSCQGPVSPSELEDALVPTGLVLVTLETLKRRKVFKITRTSPVSLVQLSSAS